MNKFIQSLISNLGNMMIGIAGGFVVFIASKQKIKLVWKICLLLIFVILIALTLTIIEHGLNLIP